MTKIRAAAFLWLALMACAHAQPLPTKPNTSNTVSQCASNVPLVGGGAGASSVCHASGALGTAAFVNTGTGGGTLGLLNTANTWSAAQTFPNNSLTLAEFPTIGANTVIGSVAGGTPAALSQAQHTAMINLATASLSGALPAWPNDTSKFFRADGTYVILNCAALAGVAASCATDTTTLANVSFTGLSAAAAAVDADTFPTNQGAGNLKQTLAAIKTWIKAWIVKADVGLGSVDNTSDATKTSTLVAAVHTWAATQTFTVAPVFTDASGSRTAIGLGNVPNIDATKAQNITACVPVTSYFTSGSNATYTTPTCSGVRANYIEIDLQGGGGGGAGSGTSPGAATAGGDTCWNTSGTACTTPVYDAGGGGAGSTANAGVGAGGAVSGSGTCDAAMAGAVSGAATASTAIPGGFGGTSSFGGQGYTSFYTGPGGGGGTSALANSGSGGGGASAGSVANSGSGGGAGARCLVRAPTPASSYVYTVGPPGTGGTAGTSGSAGGTGSAGRISVIARWQ